MGRKGAHRRPRTPRRHRWAALRVLLAISVVWFFVAEPTTAASAEPKAVLPRPIRIAAARPATPIVLATPATTTSTAAPKVASGASLPVSLTFDDGPNAEFTPQILDVLKRYRVRATFFVVGSEVEQFPALARRIVAEGHVLGNHTWSHANLTQVTAEELSSEIDRTQLVLSGLGAAHVRCLRAPYGRVNQSVRDAAHARGLAISKWTTDSADWKRPGTKAIVARALAGTEPGAVLLFHDGGPDLSQTVAALPAIITGIQAKGLRLAPIC